MLINLVDKEVFQLLLEGSQDALGELYRRHYVFLVRYATTICEDESIAQDIVCDAFIHLWQKKGAEVPNNVKGFLVQCVKNRCISHTRKPKFLSLNDESHADQASNIMDTRYIDAEVYQQLYKHLQNLTVNEKEVVKLLLQGYSVNEIAAKLNKSQPLISKLKKNALKRLQNSFQPGDRVYRGITTFSEANSCS